MLHVPGRLSAPTRSDVGGGSGPSASSRMMLESLLDAGEVRVNAAVFQPGCRTPWHTHERGQLFFFEHGRGTVATRDQAQLVRPGDLLFTPADEEHWHGAAPDSIFTYTVVSLGATHFLDEVLQADYDGVWV